MVRKREDGGIPVVKVVFYICIGVAAYHYAPQIIDFFVDSGARDTIVGELEKL